MSRLKASSYESKTVKKKKLDKELNIKVIKNMAGERIFVEFSSDDGRLVLQKSFQDNYHGNKEAEEFQKRIKNISDLRKYFGLERKIK